MIRPKWIEICVPEAQLSAAVECLVSAGLFRNEGWPEHLVNYFTAYKAAFPRLAHVETDKLPVIVYPDSFFHLSPLAMRSNKLLDGIEDSEISRQIKDVSSNKRLVLSLSMVKLAPLLEGLCRLFIDSGKLNDGDCDCNHAMNAEQLVDGMDLDADWCLRNLQDKYNEAFTFALRLANGRDRRIDPFWPDQVTCYIADVAERDKLLKVPGRECKGWHICSETVPSSDTVSLGRRRLSVCDDESHGAGAGAARRAIVS